MSEVVCVILYDKDWKEGYVVKKYYGEDEF